MLSKDVFTTLYNYNYRANARVLEHAARLSEAQLLASSGYSHGSLRDILLHTLRVEWVWRTLAQEGEIRGAPPFTAEDFPTVEHLKTRWQEEEQQMRSFLVHLGEDDLASIVQAKDPKGNIVPLARWRMLLHLILHSMQHRSEAANLLTAHGQSPGNLDFIFLG